MGDTGKKQKLVKQEFRKANPEVGFRITAGEMSFVGPRPERPTVYDDLDGKVENFRSRMQVMPGLTGYAQVNGGYDLNPAEKLKYDLIYINHCSVLFDLWCLLKTIPVVFTMKGAR